MNSEGIRAEIEGIFEAEARGALATLIRLVGDFHLAEDSLQEAFAQALHQWPTDGIPAKPRSWLISVARFKAIDSIRRQKPFVSGLDSGQDLPDPDAGWDAVADEYLKDDLLRLIFLCCHPSLSLEAQISLTLREVCGLSTAEIARAFLIAEPTLAQRIVRAKTKLREGKAPFEVPPKDELPNRLASVLRVIYLVFNEGYYASSGELLTRRELSEEAIRLGELLADLLPMSEVHGLLALMHFSEARRPARESNGEIILLDAQDRTLWDRSHIERGVHLIQLAREQGPLGYYGVQASISAEHVGVLRASDTNWNAIVALYDELCELEPSAVVRLNRAVAVAMAHGPAQGLALIDQLLARGELTNYGMAHSARADLLRRMGRVPEAVEAYSVALDLANNEPERRFLQGRIDELSENL